MSLATNKPTIASKLPIHLPQTTKTTHTAAITAPPPPPPPPPRASATPPLTRTSPTQPSPPAPIHVPIGAATTIPLPSSQPPPLESLPDSSASTSRASTASSTATSVPTTANTKSGRKRQSYSIALVNEDQRKKIEEFARRPDIQWSLRKANREKTQAFCDANHIEYELACFYAESAKRKVAAKDEENDTAIAEDDTALAGPPPKRQRQTPSRAEGFVDSSDLDDGTDQR